MPEKELAMLRDPGMYDFAPYRADRPKIVWPNGARVAFWVAPNIEHYELQPPNNPTRAPWPKPLPDVLGYSWRDYGNRVGFDRMADVMAKYGVRGSVSLNVALCEHFPDIIDRCNELDWELFSHGSYNTRYLYNLTEDEQREVIRDSRDTIMKFSGQSLDGWLSPAITNTDETQHLLAEEGLLYTLDSFEDDQPMPCKTRSGKKFVSLPYSIEVNDVPLFSMRNMGPDEYVETLKAQFDQLYLEGADSGTVMCIPLHPFLIGQPQRIGALDKVLEYVTGHDKVWLATGREIAAYYRDHYYDAFESWMADVNKEAA